MKTIELKFQIKECIDCYDGEVHIKFVPCISTNGGMTYSSMEKTYERHTTHASAMDRITDTMQEFDYNIKVNGLTSVTYDSNVSTVRVRTHHHIGEYGSPKLFPCTALRGY